MAHMMTLDEAARALAAERIGPDVAFDSVATDTRTLEPAALFVALPGEHHDGHDFLAAAAAAGAAAALIERAGRARAGSSGLPLLCVERTRPALAALARDWRRRFAVPAIAIVGSNGKTTTKELTASILRAWLGPDHVLATAGNLNNDIGLPLTVLRMRPRHGAAVLEIGMNHPGETAGLAAVAAPTVGLINNAQREHQEFMESVEAVAAEHGALIDALPVDGTAVLNADDPHYRYWRDRAAGRATLSFGLGAQADVSAAYRLGAEGSSMEIRLPQGLVRATLSIPGEHSVRNALAAAAAASAAGAPPESIGAGLTAAVAARGRLQRRPGRRGTTLIDDSYNANPDSVRAAIDVLAPAGGRAILVLGDMGEVGAQGSTFHREVGAYARARGIGRLLVLGEAAKETAAAFGAGAEHFASPADLLARIEPELAPGTAILVKGSRFMRMERVADALAEAPAGA